MKAYANALGQYNVRVNTIHPTGVATGMIMNEAFAQFIADHPEATVTMQNVLPVEVLEPGDISNAVVFLCSDAGRYITGVTLPVDAGFCNS
jgi:NAD(P)-dependent dehydrogenase (short-subunit alcohol dehydrogenase family)